MRLPCYFRLDACARSGKTNGTMNMLHSLVVTSTVALVLGATPTVYSNDSLEFSSLIRGYAADQGDVTNYYDLPGAPIRFERLGVLYSNWLSRLDSVNFEKLPQSSKIDYLLMQNDLDRSLNALAQEKKRWAELDPLLSFRSLIYTLEQARWQGTPIVGQTAASQITELSLTLKTLKERIEQGLKTNVLISATNLVSSPPSTIPPPLRVSPAEAQRAAASVDQLRGILKRWFSFYNGYQPNFSWWLKTPYEEADKQLEGYAKYLKEEVAGLKGKDDDPLIGQPIGAGELANAIRHEILPYDAEALLKIGERERHWCEVELKRAAGKMGLGEDWQAALAKIKADYVEPGQQDALVSQTARQAISFVKARKLVTIPPLCEETWHLTMMSPEAMKTIPYAAYNNQNMMVAFARDDMKHDDKLMTMRGNNRYFVHNVTPHELIPGHHLQQFQAQRHNQVRAFFSTPFYVEGWALYWERRLWDLGWAQSPEEQMGMLFWRLNRAARIEVSLKFHLGQMTPNEMVDFLITHVGHERLGATSEVRRFISDGFPPLYQAAYMLGGLQFESLRKELVESGKMTEQEFNDAILAQNAIPIEWIRAELLHLPLTSKTKSTWRF
ncbi:MAG: DUF885 family protein [bacterium]|jgi:uncharacterized protein (DUF885 family)